MPDPCGMFEIVLNEMSERTGFTGHSSLKRNTDDKGHLSSGSISVLPSKMEMRECLELDVMAHICHSSTQEDEAGGP
jgi:hypothetical protein